MGMPGLRRMTNLLCPCGRHFEPIFASQEITIRCEDCEPLTWRRLRRLLEKAS